MSGKTSDMPGRTFGEWLVLSVIKNSHPAHCLALCSCGNRRRVNAFSLRRGTSTRCGSCGNKTHGKHTTRTYTTWRCMHGRVRGKVGNYEHVDICSRWSSFENFLADMGERPEGRTLDRIDSEKGYSPTNCRWATRVQQNRNRRPNKSCASGVVGVRQTPSKKKWIARIRVREKLHYLGTFDTIEEAAAARKAGVDKYWGDER